MNENNPLNLAEHCLVTLTFKLQCCKGLAVTHSLCKQSLFIKKKALTQRMYYYLYGKK